MSYLEKEHAILTSLQATNYEMFDGDKEEALDFVTAQLEKFPNYANIVIREQIMLPIWRNRLDGTELRDKTMEIDSKRRIAHNSAIDSVNILNRLCGNLKLEPFADIDTKDRYAVADFIGNYVNEIYNQGIGNSDSAYEKTMEYNEKAHSQQLKEVPELNLKNNNTERNLQHGF